MALLLVITLAVPTAYIPARAEETSPAVELTEDTTEESGEEETEEEPGCSTIHI